MISSNTKSEVKFQMIQDYTHRFKMLKSNLIQSEQLNKSLKQELLKFGSQCNSLIISVSSLTNRIDQLRSILPQKEKQLYYTKEQLKRYQYKTQKHEIKLKQYEQRVKRFEDMYKAKKQKNQTLKEKIQKLESKLSQQKQKQNQILIEINHLQPKIQPSNMQSLKIQSMYLKSINQKQNPLDTMEISILNNQMRTKKLKNQKEQLQRKNNQLKSNINKLQHKIKEIITFLSECSCIPQFNEGKHEVEQKEPKITSRNQKQREQKTLRYSKVEKYSSSNSRVSEDRIKQPSSKLPNHIISSLSSFQNLKSKSILDQLVEKHSYITQQQKIYLENIQENSVLMNEMSKINSVLESQIAQQNSKLSAFNIKSKKYTQMHKKSLY